MTTIFHWFVAVYLVLSDVHTFYSLPTIDDNAVSFRFSPLFIVLSIFAITMCRQLIMKIIFFIINGPRTVFNTHLCHDSFINSLKKQKEERRLNHN